MTRTTVGAKNPAKTSEQASAKNIRRSTATRGRNEEDDAIIDASTAPRPFVLEGEAFRVHEALLQNVERLGTQMEATSVKCRRQVEQ